MELIAKISKGSRMDQVYIPKNRIGFPAGDYVIVKPLEREKQAEKLYFYNTEHIEPVKLEIVKGIIGIIDKSIGNENVIITGSFVEQGFHFNDIDILLVTESEANARFIENAIENKVKIKTHIILLNNKTLVEGLSTDPLYQMMLSKCIAKKRFIYGVKSRINYKILDLHLLKSRTLIDNFDLLDGNEKHYLTRNMVAISLFLKNRKIGKEEVDKGIIRMFNLKNINEMKQNILDKKAFLEKYKKIYKKTFDGILEGIKHGAEQE